MHPLQIEMSQMNPGNKSYDFPNQLPMEMNTINSLVDATSVANS